MQTNLLSLTSSVLSESEEMYLAAIARIQESKGTGPVPLSQLASSMEVLPVSANQMVRKLEEEGLVRYTPYKGVELTSAGAQAAQRILRHRRLWEIFLVELLHYTPEESDPLACRLEHILPTEAAERLAVFLSGRSEPSQSQPTSQNQEGAAGPVLTHSLSQARLNERGKIIAIYGDPAIRSFLELQGMCSGAWISVVGTSGSELLVESETGRVVLLSARLADSIRIIPE